PVCSRLAIFVQETLGWTNQRRIHDWLWPGPVSGGVHTRTRQFPGHPQSGPVHGSVAVTAHDHSRYRVPYLVNKMVPPSVDSVTVSLPASIAGPALAALIAIMRGW